MDKKKLATIIIFSLVCILLGFIIYRVFFASKIIPPAPITQTNNGTQNPFPNGQERDNTQTNIDRGSTNLPISNNSSDTITTEVFVDESPIVRIVDDPVVNPSLDTKGQLRFYNETDGRFYRIGANGNPEQLSDDVFFNVDNVTFSPKNNESIIEYPDGANIYYNFDTRKKVTLPKHWEEFSFAPAGDKISSKSIACIKG